MKRGFGSTKYPAGAALRAQKAGNAAQKAAGKRFSFADDREKAAEAGRKGGTEKARRRAATL